MMKFRKKYKSAYLLKKPKTYKSAYLLLRSWVNVREDLERATILDNLQAMDYYEDELVRLEREMEIFVILNS